MNKVTSTGLNLVSNINEKTSKNINSINKELVLGKEPDLQKNDIAGKSFLENVSNAIDSVASAQNDAATITKNYELGKEQDLTKVIVNQQISKLAFQVTLNVRNKVLSAYKDIMNMPV
ncbi:MAG: flagellar hook-basal body complex protein FliE [Phycisphaerae bacterium]|nr:flagellar hook-basal body complex protein FliE [Phycisphaerae bacterium]|tara:strand:+ start:283 stop:636 length:354 start_codon:yes stop_codon:yes gene_type:complete